MRFVAVCLLTAALAAPAFADTRPGDSAPPAKSSSFAPHHMTPGHSYGAPIQGQILHKRVHKKPDGANRPS
jgi:hypothetical protein